MTGEQQERKQELVRLEDIRRELPAYLAKVSGALEMTLGEEAVMAQELSDPLQHELSTRVSEGLQKERGDHHHLLSRAAGETFVKEFQRLMAKFTDETILLSLGVFHKMPLLELSAKLVGPHFFDLWKAGDTVTIASTDATRGLMADVYPDDLDASFELVYWGME